MRGSPLTWRATQSASDPILTELQQRARHAPSTTSDCSGITLACVDGVDPQLAACALDLSRRGADFDRVVLLSPTRCAVLPRGIEWLQIPPLDFEGYQRFMLRELHQHIDTPFALTIQTDGWLLRPELLFRELLAYDYIGAPWPEAEYSSRSTVGNSGCCLRSLRLLQATAELATEQLMQQHPPGVDRLLDDVWTCHTAYDTLVASGLQFADPRTASYFSVEFPTQWGSDLTACAGYHGRHHAPTRWLRQELPAWIDRQKIASPPRFRNRNVNRVLPESGLISPGAQKVIQLEITNACPHRCSNCTRLVSHQVNPYMMDRATLIRAVASVQDHPGMVGIMGGEPTIHPDFAWITKHAHDVLQSGQDSQDAIAPIPDFAAHRERHLNSLHHRLGLWTSLGAGYRRHYELIQRVFGYQCINTHESGGLHQALLMAPRDLGIDEGEWTTLRDRCWVQRLWSGSVNDKGAYFCEIAAAIDRLFFGGAHAWTIEPGWWQRTPAEFGRQLDLCRYCSAPLSVHRRPDADQLDDVTPTTAELLTAAASPAVGRLVIHTSQIDASPNAIAEPYLETSDGNQATRIGFAERSIRPQHLDGLTVCVGYADALRITSAHNRRHFDRFVIVTVAGDADTQRVANEFGAEVILSERQHHGQAPFCKAALLNDALERMDPRHWLVLHDADILLPPSLRDWACSRALNPGVLHWTTRYHARTPEETDAAVRDWSTVQELTWDCEGADQKPWGYFHLFHPSASVLAGSLRMQECFPTAGSVDHEFMLRWPADRRFRIDDDTRTLSVVHVWHGPPANGWHAKREDDRSLWQMVSLTAEEVPWYERPIHYPCWLRIIRVASAQEHTVYAASPADAPVIGCGVFGLRDAEGRIRWGLDQDPDGQQLWLWDGLPCNPSQFDLYQIGVPPQ